MVVNTPSHSWTCMAPGARLARSWHLHVRTPGLLVAALLVFPYMPTLVRAPLPCEKQITDNASTRSGSQTKQCLTHMHNLHICATLTRMYNLELHNIISEICILSYITCLLNNVRYCHTMAVWLFLHAPYSNTSGHLYIWTSLKPGWSKHRRSLGRSVLFVKICFHDLVQHCWVWPHLELTAVRV